MTGDEEILICKKCGKKLKHGDRVASLEFGDLEIETDELDGEEFIIPVCQGSETRAMWCEACCPIQ